MTRDLEDDLPLRGRLTEEYDEPTAAWKWYLMAIGMAVGFFGVLILVMGALMSETTAPRSGDYVHVTQYHVSSWLFWLGGACLLTGTGLCWPGYRSSFARHRPTPAPPWLAPTFIVVGICCSLAALQVALAAAPSSKLHAEAYLVTVFTCGMLLVAGIGAMVQASRDRARKERGVGDGGAVATGEADDAVG